MLCVVGRECTVQSRTVGILTGAIIFREAVPTLAQWHISVPTPSHDDEAEAEAHHRTALGFRVPTLAADVTAFSVLGLTAAESAT